MYKFKLMLTAMFLITCGILQAQSVSSDVNRLRNMRASSAEQELDKMGYELSSVDKTSTGIYQYWYNNRLNRCLQSTIYDGRVVNVRTVDGSKCGEAHSASSSYLNLNSLRGKSEASASTQLQREGYRVTQTESRGSGKIDMYWYNANQRRCLKMMVQNAYVQSVVNTSTSNCSEASKNTSSGGYFNLSALDGMRENDASTRMQREGYRVTSTSRKSNGEIDMFWYHASDRRCVKMVVKNNYVRSIANTSTSYCNSNYNNNKSSGYSSSKTSMSYLNGMAALQAYDQLKDRGYRESKSHQDGGKTYRVWYNSRTGECIKTLSQNRRITEVIPSERCDMSYLKGMAALSAYDELKDNGFLERKSHQDDGKTYRVWYNSRTGACVKTLSQNRRITEIMESNRCDD